MSINHSSSSGAGSHDADARSLRLVVGGLAGVVDEVAAPSTWDAPLPTARPADRCEPWPISSDDATPLLRAAGVFGVAFELAAVVTVERSLLRDDLHGFGLGEIESELDIAARAATVTCELSDPLSAYLRALDRGPRVRKRPRHLTALPMRLTERLGSQTCVGPHLDPTLLPSAIVWERAAVLAGHTMTEWAMRAVASRSAR
jgi:hypothetical protein